VKIWTEAMKIQAVAEVAVFSKSFARRRFRLSHENVRSTTPSAWQHLETFLGVGSPNDLDGPFAYPAPVNAHYDIFFSMVSHPLLSLEPNENGGLRPDTTAALIPSCPQSTSQQASSSILKK
jgi:hypothetical protein